MAAILGLNHGLTVGLLILIIAAAVIVVGALGYRWVAHAQATHITRGPSDRPEQR
jgi:hypothetical protein